MRTSMNIPKELLEEAMRLGEASSKTMAVVMSLQEFIQRRKIERFLKLKGSGALGLSQKDLKHMRKR